MPNERICSVNDCGKPYKSRGLCNTHYEQWRRNSHGHPPIGERLQTERGSLLRWINDVAVPYEGNECLPWPFNNSTNGRGAVRVNGRMCSAPRVICEIANGPPPSPFHQAAHSCGNGHLGCLNPKHLRWATPLENQQDRLTHGTHNRGSRNCEAKLTEEQVQQIRALAGNLSQRKIARKFGVAKSTVARIHHGTQWAFLK